MFPKPGDQSVDLSGRQYRSGSRIVMVIVPVAFIAGAPKGAGDQPTGQNTTFLSSQNTTFQSSHYNTCHTRIQMSTFQLIKNV
ncbi:hypothetical protein, partial [Burkholderia cepacia]